MQDVLEGKHCCNASRDPPALSGLSILAYDQYS